MCAATRPGLTRQTLIETALRLLDEVGLEGLTVRRLAAELGVQSPALYWHIRSKQELLDGMADAVILAAGMGPPHHGEAWQDWLARRARAFRQSLLAHRDGARIVADATWLGPATVRTFNDELAAMVERGFTPVLALRTITAVSQYVTGFVLQEQARRPGRQADQPSDPLAALTDLLDGDTDAPLLAAIRDGARTTGDDAFEHGLQALIDGTTAALAAHRT
ncbi:TetR/AcrR family transcriptional regulator C-terminal domain-containing protein [Nonomuraea sp. NPDC050786]|uniref:TetR/AcrR family transcriptional regulator C-terminal domain-containing protein n=1 Tax=Nonomuraea sp. NPDC050786 TaxID=3154840 RepID=UPI0033E1CB64